MKGLLRLSIAGLASILLVGATIAVDTRLEASPGETISLAVSPFEKAKDAQFVYQKDGSYLVTSGATTRLSLRIGDSALLRLAPQTSIELEVKNTDTFPHIHAKIKQGRLWVNTLSSSFTSDFETSSVRITGGPGIYDIQYGEKTLLLTAVRHRLIASMLGNRLVIPESRQMTIPESKLLANGSTIAQLRYSKLSKEFPYSQADLSGTWISQNTKDDNVFFDAYYATVLQVIRDRGPVLASSKNELISKAVTAMDAVVNVLTIDPAKRNQREMQQMIDAFHASLDSILVGNEERTRELLAQVAGELPQLLQAPEHRLAVARLYSTVAFARPGDGFFPAKKVIRDSYDAAAISKVRDAFTDILDKDAQGDDAATQQNVTTRLRQFGALVDSIEPDLNTDPKEVFLLSIEFSDFLDRNPRLLLEEHLHVAEIFERSYLASLSTRVDADESRQYFISEKLKRIKVAKMLMENGDLSFQNARKTILLLANQIEALSPTSSDAAVISYFENQLKDLSPLIAFLRSTTADNLHGSFKENFEDFTQRVDEMKKVTELLALAAGGSQISPFRREELAGIVATDLGSIGFVNIRLTLPDSEDSTNVAIGNAEFESNKIAGAYDTARKLFSAIQINGEKVPYSIRLENMKPFLLLKLGKVIPQDGQTVESLVERNPAQDQSLLEKVAKETLISQMKGLGITVEDKYIGLEDFNTSGLIHVRLATLGESPDAKIFSFDIVQKTGDVVHLIVQTVSGQIPVNGSFSVKELTSKVTDIYQRALFEKAKEEEIKNASTTPAMTQPKP